VADDSDLVALFPLPNVVLFPDVDLPLHVFEPRYRAMVGDAMNGDRRIGMVLLRADWRRDDQGSPTIFPLGCLGGIEKFELLADGRSNLLLQGLRRFEVVEEIGGKPYRQARVRWRDEATPAAGSAAAVGVAARLRSAVGALFEGASEAPPAGWWEGMPEALAGLVNRLGFALDLEPVEKLSLLDCDDALSRSQRLVEILEFLAAERRLGAGSARGEGAWH